MKALQSLTEIREHYKGVRRTERIRIEFKTANRTIHGIGVKDVPYPVFLPADGVQPSEFYADLEKLGHDTRKLMRNGQVLYSIKLYVPDGLVPKKREKAKNPPQSFIDKIVGEAKTLEEFKTLQADFTATVNRRWKEAIEDTELPDFPYVTAELAKELNKDTDALLK